MATTTKKTAPKKRATTAKKNSTQKTQGEYKENSQQRFIKSENNQTRKSYKSLKKRSFKDRAQG
jgi:hypothetical protein